MNFTKEKAILPAFSRTPHLPYQPNATDDDPVAETSEATGVFTDPVNVEEKLDGASVGMTLYEEHPLIRNRDHILRKGFMKETAAKQQFRPIWNWFYENKHKFEAILEFGPYSVYGEWCLAKHGIDYSDLPDWFIAYDLYNFEKKIWVSPPQARAWLEEAGFTLPKLFHQGVFDGGYEELSAWASGPASWSSELTEGIYLKVYDKNEVVRRFKMVRPGFTRGIYWNPDTITKNSRAK